MAIRLKPAEAAALGLTGRRSKYRAVPTLHNGVRYASKAEAARRAVLDLDPSVRLVVDQPTFRLGVPENVYRADFLVLYLAAEGLAVRVEDVKGVRTAKFARDAKLWRAYGKAPLWIVTGGRVVEVIVPEARPDARETQA